MKLLVVYRQLSTSIFQNISKNFFYTELCCLPKLCCAEGGKSGLARRMGMGVLCEEGRAGWPGGRDRPPTELVDITESRLRGPAADFRPAENSAGGAAAAAAAAGPAEEPPRRKPIKERPRSWTGFMKRSRAGWPPPAPASPACDVTGGGGDMVALAATPS